MSAMALDSSGQFRIGSVFNGAWRIFAGNFLFFVGISLIVSLPQLLILSNRSDPTALGWSFVIALFAGLILNTIGQAVILFGAFQDLRGHPVQAGEAVQRALGRFFPLIGVGLLTVLAIFFASMLLVVPGLILMVMWAVVVPACVVEGLGPSGSMARSSALTKGHRWKIFGTIILLLIINAIASNVVGLILGPAGFLVAIVGSLAWTAVWTAYWNCVLIMIYHDLRVAKEGIDTEQIASVFD
jgi:hypothetical protein